MNHSIITLAAVLAASLFGWQWQAALAMAAFWAGREHAQAEYRWLTANKANRSRMPWQAGFLPESWNRDGLVNDLLLPGAIGGAIAWALALWSA
ncbi:hypothetical protein HNR62_001029 [Oceanisphaera litoralis]|uniref:hypothetical protein n=1 Tax=Oceanisphaera litoralis TaxID=225144 RepID=UPI00195C2784|nr:hypothetical protein [Oceanisphaera litoralis]MBM7455169.1 hypothetical protein [Oceanisphaera litoralis]